MPDSWSAGVCENEEDSHERNVWPSVCQVPETTFYHKCTVSRIHGTEWVEYGSDQYTIHSILLARRIHVGWSPALAITVFVLLTLEFFLAPLAVDISLSHPYFSCIMPLFSFPEYQISEATSVCCEIELNLRFEWGKPMVPACFLITIGIWIPRLMARGQCLQVRYLGRARRWPSGYGGLDPCDNCCRQSSQSQRSTFHHRHTVWWGRGICASEEEIRSRVSNVGD